VPTGGGVFIAALGIVLYFADVALLSGSPLSIEPGVWLQLSVIAVVTLAVRSLSVRLRESGEGKDLLVAALEQTRHQAEDILRNIRSGVFTVDAQGKLLYANPTAEHLLGINLIVHTGEPVLDVIGAVAPDLAHAVKRAAESKIRTVRGECVVCTEVRRFPVGLTTTYTEQDENGCRPNRDRDLSGHLRSEDARRPSSARRATRGHRRAERVARRTRSRTRSPRSEAPSSRSRECPPCRTIRKHSQALVMRESDRLSRLLSEFLDFARVRVAKTESVNLARIARDAASLAAAHPDREASVKVTCVIPEGDDVQMEGDEDLLHRAVFNLALNAVQASPASTEVRVEVAHWLLRSAARGNRVRGRGGIASRQRLGSGIPPAFATVCSILFLPPKRTAADSDSPSCIAPSRRIAVSSSSTTACAVALASQSFCRRHSRWPGVFDDRTRGQAYCPRRRRRERHSRFTQHSAAERGFTPHVAHGGKAGLEKMEELNPDIVLTDIRMPNVSGVEILAAARASDPDVPVILMTAQATLQSAMQAVNEGAFYYIQKPFRNDELVAILRRAAEHRNLRIENKSLKQVIRRHERQGVTRPIGTSKSWLEVLRLVETVAPTDSTVLIQGESGTGKEVIARYIHELSARSEGSFLSINCGALPEKPARERVVRAREGLVHLARCETSSGYSARRRRARSSSTKSARRLRQRRSSCFARYSIAK
jgi:CheY-like chemotaxis protein/PAS domain-containing protein